MKRLWPTFLLALACEPTTLGETASDEIASDTDGGVVEAHAEALELDLGAHEDGESLPPGYLALTYDDGPGASTFLISRYLHELGVPATFFVNGCHLEGAPPSGVGAASGCSDASRYRVSALQTLVREGHRLANHTQDHVGLRDGPANLESQFTTLQRTLDPFQRVDRLAFFRPPGNAWSASNQRRVDADAYLSSMLGPMGQVYPRRNPDGGTDEPPGPEIMEDWLCLDSNYPPSYCARVFLDAIPETPTVGGIVLLHDRRRESAPNDARARRPFEVTRALVPRLLERGYVIVPLDAVPGVLGPRRFELEGAGYWTREMGDGVGWNVAQSHWGSLELADVDGDGRLEMCGRGNTGVRCVESTDHGFAEGRTVTAAFSDADGYLPTRYGATLMFGDLDGDGDDDVCARFGDGIRCARSRATSGRLFETHATLWSRGGDFSDAAQWHRAESRWGSLRLVDVSGDGRADVCGRSPTGVVCAVTRVGGGFERAALVTPGDFEDADGFGVTSRGATLMFGDLDGDGDADVCARGELGLWCAKNTAGSFSRATLWVRGRFSDRDQWTSPAASGSLQLVDANGDGRADVCGRAPTGVVCAYSDGASRFLHYQHLMNQGLTNRDVWSATRFGATLRIGRLGLDRAVDVCARGPHGLWCARGSDVLAQR
ncbi:MAG: polysaccharide deacetylase family protein [Sandaracinus sp.]|nr:polysaccharide deacetylase family protein [Sandaracinus sp.]MCB9633911.1 polysaccharide deacetylase family protein [Sandaracinus sp.]